MRQMLLFFIISFAILFSGLSPLFAQTNEELYQLSVEDMLNRKVIATTRTSAEASSKTPASVAVITSTQIEDRGYQSLLDLLYDLPSIKIDFGSDTRWFHDVTIRGIRGMDNFIILLDGIRISSPTNDVIPVMENFPIHFASQVEVVYGPASALYGADAFVGVINIITKKPQDAKFKGNGSLSGGMYGRTLGNAYAGKKLGTNSYITFSGQLLYDQQPKLWEYYPAAYVGIEALQSGTLPTIFGPTQVDGLSPKPALSPIQTHAFSTLLKLGNFQASIFTNKAKIPTAASTTPSNTIYNKGYFLGHSVSMLNMTYNATISEKLDLTSYLTGSYYRLDPKSSFRNTFSGMNQAFKFSNGLMLKAEEIAHYRATDNLELVSGLTFEYFDSYPRGHDLTEPITGGRSGTGAIIGSQLPNNPDGISADLPHVVYKNIGAFAQINYNLSTTVRLTLGSRFDHNTRFGSTVNPRFGFVWEKKQKASIKFLIGTAYLAPSPLLAYNQYGSFFSLDDGTTYQSAFFHLPNPTLNPQLLQNMELIGSYYLTNNLRLTANAYLLRITGLFNINTSDDASLNLYGDEYKGWPVDFIEITTNQGEQTNYGGSLQLDFVTQKSIKNTFHAYLNLSLSEGTLNTGEFNHVQTPGITPLMLKYGVDLHKKRWSISSRCVWVSKQRVFAFKPSSTTERQQLDGFIDLRAHLIYRFNTIASVFLRGDNLLNQRYTNVNLGASPETDLQGATAVEFTNGTPQYPIRLHVGISLKL